MLSDEQIEAVIEAAESAVGMGHGAWDMVNPRDLVRAIEASLSQSTEQGERDAARYRWLRQQRDPWGWKVQAVWKGESTVIQSECGERLDAAIDAAMSPHGDGVNYTRAEGGEDGHPAADALRWAGFGPEDNQAMGEGLQDAAGLPGTPNDQQEQPR